MASTLVLSWLTVGVQLKWGSSGPPAEPIDLPNHSSCEQYASFLDEAVQGLLAKGAIAVAKVAPYVISPLAVIERRGKLRMVLDLSRLNSHLAPPPKFTYETIKEAATVFEPGDWMFSVDLEAAYHHVDMHPSAWRYLGFHWRGQTYVFKVLPFGLSWACWHFTKITRELAGHLRSLGIRCLHYLDDFGFGVAPDDQGGDSHCQAVRQRVLGIIAESGFIVQPAKLSAPAQRMTLLGFQIDSVAGTLSASAVRAQELTATAQEAVAAGDRAPARLLARVAGQVASLRPALGHAAGVLTRSIHACLPTSRSGWRRQVAVSGEAREDLQFWATSLATVDGQPLWPSTRVDTLFYSDAGAAGWGGHITRPDGGTEEARGLLSASEQAASSTLREAWALERNLLSLPGLAGRRVRACVDNEGLEWAWLHGSRVPEINAVIKRISAWCRRTGTRLTLHWLPRRWNQRADALSKQGDPDGWQLNPRFFRVLDKRWGPHTWDRFASDTNSHCQLFSSTHWCPGTQGLDAFSFDWEGTNSWCNPPFALIPRVIEHLRLCKAAGTLLCPVWPTRPWWHYICPDGATLAPYVVDWVEVPAAPDAFIGPGLSPANAIDGQPPRWRVLALRVDFTAKQTAVNPKRRRILP